MEEEKLALVQSLIDAVNQIASIGDYRCSVKKEYCNLARRLKLLTPLFEEIREIKEQIPEETLTALVSLNEALFSAKELLRFGSEGSKIYLIIDSEQIMHKFHEVTAKLEQALSGISYENLDISDEVKEQVELVLAQLRRAKGRVDAPDVELYEDLLSLYNKSNDASADPDVLRRLAEKLQLMGIAELMQESLALHDMVSATDGDPDETFEKMSNILNKIKDFVQTENPNLDASAREKNLPPSSSGQATSDGNHRTPVIPDDFCCSISPVLMEDPIIVSKGQVELVLAQFRRPKGRVEAPDVEPYSDLLSLYNKSNDASADPDVLRRLAEKLQLMGIAELMQESLSLHDMVSATDGDPDETFEKMSNILNKIKDFVQTENPNLDASAREKNLPPSSSGQATSDGNHRTPVIPDDFRCPISLELMEDPVIVSTGQTYERSCIEKWLEQGHGTCPKTQQTLRNCALTPNYVLRSLIAQWCEANGIEPPKRPSSSRPSKTTSACSPAERTKIEILLRKLVSSNLEDQRMAAGEIRLLAKRNADNRVAIAEAGAIPLLVNLLSTPDSRTQEHAVTALLNLSICEGNKGSIISFGAVPGIVQVLKKGSMEARENAAATLFSLSVVDENKVRIGALGAIPPLVTLLSEGTQRGKKDAATALFNLCIYQGNKGKAVRAGVVPTLMRLLTEPGGGMVDEALAILAILASHPEGKSAIGAAEAVPVLVDVIGNGSPRNRENAAAVLVHLCAGDQQHLAEAQEIGVMGPLVDLAQNGTDRGKRKAAQLLESMSRFVEEQKLAQAQAEAQAQQSQSQSQTQL